MKPGRKVIVGMSGGVDSSVAAYLLIRQGFAVEGVFMKNWEGDDDDEFCSAAQDLSDAQTVCQKLGIPFHSVNFSDQYWDRVFTLFLAEYRAGRTPNPDVLCNTEIKFKAFLDHAIAQGAEGIATGHYARRCDVNGVSQLHMGLDSNKDQSYFLHGLSGEQLSRSLFPVGELNKSEVRAIAKEQGFENHNKKDSTGICFIGERKFKTFLQEYLLIKPGDIVTPDGEILGKHDGLMFYTIGQRQGLKIGGLANAEASPWYVAEKNLESNTLVVVQGQENPALYADELRCENIHWINESPKLPLRCSAKTRYRQANQECEVVTIADEYIVKFAQPQRAITPGQYVVFYQDSRCLGGAIISRAHKR